MQKTKINFFVEKNKFRIINKKLIKSWITQTLSCEKKSFGLINIIICTDNFLIEINQKYLSHDTFTDIITFDYSDENASTGEIYISIDRVKENAGIFGVNVHDELHRVIIHGILHLCGYKDKSKKEKEKMTTLEDYYLSLWPVKSVVSA